MAAISFHFEETGAGDAFRIAVPRFGTKCVCCSADAAGKTLEYNPNAYSEIAGKNVRAPPIPMPVCAACEGHALNPSSTGSMMGSLLGLGVLGLVGGFFMNSEMPIKVPLLGAGAGLIGLAVAWAAFQSWREKREQVPGHAPFLHYEIHPGMTVIFTQNEALVAELLALNPGAKRHGP